jgi:transposase
LAGWKTRPSFHRTIHDHYPKGARSEISEVKFRELLCYFAADPEVTQIALLSGFSRDTVSQYLKAIRESVAEHCEFQSSLSGEIDVDESFFGTRRVQDKRGQGAYSETIVFGLIERHGKM